MIYELRNKQKSSHSHIEQETYSLVSYKGVLLVCALYRLKRKKQEKKYRLYDRDRKRERRVGNSDEKVIEA